VRVKASPVSVDNGDVAEQSSLSVTWISYVVPWVALRVVVDGVDVGRVGYRKPATVDLAAGPHEVELRGHRGYASQPMRVEIPANGGVELFGGNARMPSGMRGYRQIKAWAKESSIWLGTDPVAPPTRAVTVSAELRQLTDSEVSGFWYGRRRWIPVFAVGVVLWSVSAVRTPHVWGRLIDVALIIAAGHRGYVYWIDPLPPWYAERLRNEPPFGAKLWHKLAIAFLAAFVLLVVAALVGLLK
jgi:hypothetical protein